MSVAKRPQLAGIVRAENRRTGTSVTVRRDLDRKSLACLYFAAICGCGMRGFSSVDFKHSASNPAATSPKKPMSDKHYTHSSDATHLETALRRTKPWFEANATFLIYGLAVVLAVVAAIVWMQRQPEQNSAASALLMDADGPEDFQNIADQYEGTPLANLARLKQADTLLNSASSKLFTDRTAANAELEQAEAALNRLPEASGIDAAVRDRVAINLARLTEMRCDGTEESIQGAIDAWQNVLTQNENSIGKLLAEGQIAELKKASAADFYAWFQPLDPKPADDLSFPGLPGGTFGPESVVPEVPPNAEFPMLDELKLDGLTETPAPDDSNAHGEDSGTPVEETETVAEPEEASSDAPGASEKTESDSETANEEPAAGESETTEESGTDGTAPEEEAAETPDSEESADSEPEADASE